MGKASADLLEREFQFYLDNQEKLVEQYDGRVIVLKGGQVIGDFDSEGTAVSITSKAHEIGTFLVQRVSSGKEDYTQTFRSRVRG